MPSRIKEKLKKINWLRRLKKAIIDRYFSITSNNLFYPIYALQWRCGKFLMGKGRRRVYFKGVSISLPCFNSITHARWYRFLDKEPEVLKALDVYLSDGDVFFDIGANIGVHSIYAAKICSAKVYAFEPEYSNLHLLKENIIMNQLEKNIIPYAIALSNELKITKLHLQDLQPGSACHSESRKNIHVTKSGFQVKWAEGIASFRMDDICDQIQQVPNVIKIDTDGNELEVLLGANKTLQHSKLKVVIIELPDDYKEKDQCIQLLGEANFQKIGSNESVINKIYVRSDLLSRHDRYIHV